MNRLAVDIGARFADFCLEDDQGLHVLKRPVADNLVDTLQGAIADLNTTLDALAAIRLTTTQPLNAAIGHQPRATALVVTEGFKDVLELGRQDRRDLFAPVAQSPSPLFLVEPDAIFSVPARMDVEGHELVGFNTEDFDKICAALQSQGNTSVAISLLHADRNPAHELALGAHLNAVLPDLSISLSHQVDAAPREYERTVATLLDAWMKAESLPQIADLVVCLRAAGFAGAFEFGDNRGTIVDWAKIKQDPTTLLAGGPAAVARSGAMLVADGDAVVIDIGSKSADLCLLKGGAAVLADPGQIAGIPLRRDCVDSISLPIGGACRVAVENGLFKHGEADDPRLDSCFTALGYLPETAPSPLGTDTAHKLMKATQMYLAGQIVKFATRRNIDPNKARLIVSGGTGCLLAAGIAQALGHKDVLLAQYPALAGAAGLLMAPERFEASTTLNTWLGELNIEQFAQVFDDLGQQVRTASGGQTPAQYQLSIAPLAPMHPMTMTLTGRPKDTDELSHLYTQVFEAQNGIRPPGPGFISRLSASFDRAPETKSSATPLTPALSHAGMIHIPEGWHLTPIANGFRLEEAA